MTLFRVTLSITNCLLLSLGCSPSFNASTVWSCEGKGINNRFRFFVWQITWRGAEVPWCRSAIILLGRYFLTWETKMDVEGQEDNLTENIIIELDEYWETNFLRTCKKYDLVVGTTVTTFSLTGSGNCPPYLEDWQSRLPRHLVQHGRNRAAL